MSASFPEERLVYTEPVNFMSYRWCKPVNFMSYRWRKPGPVSPQIADSMLPATQWGVARVGIRNEKISETFLWIECWNNFEKLRDVYLWDIHYVTAGRDSSVGIATCYGLDGPGSNPILFAQNMHNNTVESSWFWVSNKTFCLQTVCKYIGEV